MAERSREVPFALIAWLALFVGVPAIAYEWFVSAAGALGSLNGSHGNDPSMTPADVIACVCGAVFVVACALAIRQRRQRCKQPPVPPARIHGS